VNKLPTLDVAAYARHKSYKPNNNARFLRAGYTSVGPRMAARTSNLCRATKYALSGGYSTTGAYLRTYTKITNDLHVTLAAA